jgi:outer membrane biosynthesis protein TonB
MFTAALYPWSVAACPVNVFLDIPLADRLRAAATASDVEIGGRLVGHIEDDTTVITDFELVESEHRRGQAYALSSRDERQLRSKLAGRRRPGREVVGFFRSHRRPGMFLDAADFHTLSDHFSNPHQVALLVRPSDDGSATGGFFFWVEGEMDRKETYLAFPLNSAELEAGMPRQTGLEFVPAATVSTVEMGSPRQAALGFDAAETLDHVPRARMAAVPISEVSAPGRPSVDSAVSRQVKIMWSPNAVKIGLIAAGAALGGYFLGTSGNREHFGSRPGDITISDATAPPPAPAPVIAAAPAKKAAPVEPAPDAQPKAPEVAAAPVPMKPKTPPPVRPNPHAVFDEMARNNPAPAPPPPPQPVVAPAPAPVAEPAVPVNSAGAFPHNPNPLPQPTALPHANATVDLEAVQDGGMKHALHLFGASYKGGQNFQPAQVLRRITPRVPAEVARELTAEVPVDLKLKVDNTGRVSAVELLSRGSDRALVQLAGDAAYGWQFQPALLKDRPVSSEVIAHFRFRPAL